jgi:hypothetical protein
MIVPFGEDEIDRTLPENVVITLGRLRHLDRGSFESALMLARADARRAQVAEAAEATRQHRENHRGIARTAPTMTADDHRDIERVMAEMRVDAIAAAAEVGRRRLAKADQQ